MLRMIPQLLLSSEIEHFLSEFYEFPLKSRLELTDPTHQKFLRSGVFQLRKPSPFTPGSGKGEGFLINWLLIFGSETEKIQCFEWENRRKTRFRAPQAYFFSPACGSRRHDFWYIFDHFRDRFLRKPLLLRKPSPFTPKYLKGGGFLNWNTPDGCSLQKRSNEQTTTC